MSGGMAWTAIYPDGPPGSASAEAGAIGAGGNPLYPGMPEGASPVHRDLAVAAAGTYTVWTPSPGTRAVVASAFVSTDTAMRVALCDGSDGAGRRIVDGYFAASGGAAANLVPVPYPADLAGTPIVLVTAGAGNVRVRVSGWEETA